MLEVGASDCLASKTDAHYVDCKWLRQQVGQWAQLIGSVTKRLAKEGKRLAQPSGKHAIACHQPDPAPNAIITCAGDQMTQK